MGILGDFLQGTASLLEGMKVTIGHFFRKPVTSEYPRQRIEMSKAQRNAIVLIPKDEVGGDSHNCIACLQCEKICPSACIKIEGERPDGLSMKRPTVFDVNFALCSECGLCLDVCPTETLGYSRMYDEAGYTREFHHDLLAEWAPTEDAARERLREEAARKKAEAQKKVEAAAAAKAKAEADAKAGEPPPAASSEGGAAS
jgi:NADH-quinone oxidoreductase subunit I